MNHKEGYQGFSMTYTPNTPANGAENIAISQPKITTNFQQLNTIFDRDHHTWNASSSSKRGYHKQLSFPDALVSDPAIGSFDAILFPKEDPLDTSARAQLYFENVTASGTTYQITNRFSSVTASATNSTDVGYWMMPFGRTSTKALIFMWGTRTNIASGTNISQAFPSMGNYVGAPVGFPNNCFNVQLTLANNDNSTSPSKTATVYSISKTGFKYNLNSSANDAIYWFAIGN